MIIIKDLNNTVITRDTHHESKTDSRLSYEEESYKLQKYNSIFNNEKKTIISKLSVKRQREFTGINQMKRKEGNVITEQNVCDSCLDSLLKLG